jgi:hypothetical protein
MVCSNVFDVSVAAVVDVSATVLSEEEELPHDDSAIVASTATHSFFISSFFQLVSE